MRYLGYADIINTLHNSSCKIILISCIFATLFGITYFVPFVFADSGGVGISSDLSSKTPTGKSSIGENSSSNTSISSQNDSNAHLSGNSGIDVNTSNVHLSGNSDTSANTSVATRSQDQSDNNHSASNESELHGHYNNSYEKISANSDDEFTAQTQKHLYKPGDTVKVHGSLWSNLMTTLGNVSTVSIQVKDGDGNIVYDGKGQVDANGDYTTEFHLSSDAKKGAYDVNVNADVGADALNTLALKTKGTLESSTKIVVIPSTTMSVQAEGHDFDVQVASNSTSVANLNFDEQNKKLSFTVQGDAGTKGVTEITIPKSLLSGDLTVMIDGQAMAQSDVVETTSTDTETTLELNYHHSTHQIDIVGTNAVPEFGTFISLVLVISILTTIGITSQIRRIHL